MQLYNPLSDFWTETGFPFKIGEPNQPSTDNLWEQSEPRFQTAAKFTSLPVTKRRPMVEDLIINTILSALVNIHILLDK